MDTISPLTDRELWAALDHERLVRCDYAPGYTAYASRDFYEDTARWEWTITFHRGSFPQFNSFSTPDPATALAKMHELGDWYYDTDEDYEW